MKTIKICAILCVLLGFGVSSFAQDVLLRISPKQKPTSAIGMIITYWVVGFDREYSIGKEPYGIPVTTDYTVRYLSPNTEYGFYVRFVSKYGVGAPCAGVIATTSESGGTVTVYMHDVPEPPRGAKGLMTPEPTQTGFQGINFLDISQFQEKHPIPYRLNE